MSCEILSGGEDDGHVDVVIPTCGRPAALAVTLTSLCAQTHRRFRVVISDQTEPMADADRRDDTTSTFERGEVRAVLRLLRAHGHALSLHGHLPRRGIAEHRQFLLDQVAAPLTLAIDDDVILEPDLLERLVSTIRRERCGFVGSALIGLSYSDDVRPHEQAIELWEGKVQPELVRPGSEAWQRHRLHNAANILHVQEQVGASRSGSLCYRVAWVGGCVLYDTEKLRACGGYRFWTSLPPEHCGEDVLVQLRVMARFGGCGVLPSGAYHQELPTTVPRRSENAVELLPISPGVAPVDLRAPDDGDFSLSPKALR